MNLRQWMVSAIASGGLAVMLAAAPGAQAFAADSTANAVTNASTNAATSATPGAAPTKKAVRAANRAFSKTVQKALQQTKGLEQSTIAVFGNAKTGHVTLAGQIESQDQDGIAVAAAKQVQGVTSVSSKLTLREQGGG